MKDTTEQNNLVAAKLLISMANRLLNDDVHLIEVSEHHNIMPKYLPNDMVEYKPDGTLTLTVHVGLNEP